MVGMHESLGLVGAAVDRLQVDGAEVSGL